MSRFGSVSLMIVNRDNFLASNVGFAANCRMMLNLSFPGIPRENYDRPEIIQMIDEVDNITGSIFVLDPVEGLPLVANSTLEKLIKEVTDA